MSGAARVPELHRARVGGFDVAAATLCGVSREINEDRVCVCGRGFCVFDGIGGLGAGEVFAELAANRVRRGLLSGRGPAQALAGASRDLASLGREVLRSPGGATGCVCAPGAGGIRFAALGDVRAFLVGPEGVEEVCRDEPGGAGAYLGDGRSAPRVSFIGEGCLDSHVLLVCSDGFWRFAAARELAEVVRGSATLADAAMRLVGLARSCASPDDVTVALCGPLVESRSRSLQGVLQ